MASERRRAIGEAFSAGARDDVASRSDAELLNVAVNRLRSMDPKLSAATVGIASQFAILGGSLAAIGFALQILRSDNQTVLLALLILPFSTILAVRVAALLELMRPQFRDAHVPRETSDGDLPRYSVLVPVFSEKDVASSLVTALSALDYPRHKLEILFLTEERDPETRLALECSGLASHMRIVTVPTGEPQTKPRALNFGLQLCNGDFVAVFDAEDVPDSQQLRRAVHTFERGGEDLVCVQARLLIHNSGENFLTQQFAFEYAALFEAILPALARLGLPLPLAGTSNHFRRQALQTVGAWDPFNVTEDADLGFRLARFNKSAAMLDSVTLEEAPASWNAWRGQRTRWLKGWMQTYLVLMRQPIVLYRQLGFKKFLGFQILLGGMIFSALVHPWFYAALLGRLVHGQPLLPFDGPIWWLCAANVVVGYLTGIVLVALAARRNRLALPAASAILVPVYWMAISLASYRAVYELYARPHHWQKTPHRGRHETPVAIAA